MSRFQGHFVLGDLRKFAEQYGDTLQWDQSDRAHILTHGVSGIDWNHCKHPLPEYVYDLYMKYWADVTTKWNIRIKVLDQFPLFNNIPRDPAWGRSVARWMDRSDRNGSMNVVHLRV